MGKHTEKINRIGNLVDFILDNGNDENRLLSYKDVEEYLVFYNGYSVDEFWKLIKYVKVSDLRQFLKDVAPSKELYYKSERWRQIKEYIREKYNYTCQRCGENKVDDLYHLHCHHKTYDNFGKEDLDNDIELLCSKCHNAHHKEQREEYKRQKDEKSRLKLQKKIAKLKL